MWVRGSRLGFSAQTTGWGHPAHPPGGLQEPPRGLEWLCYCHLSRGGGGKPGVLTTARGPGGAEEQVKGRAAMTWKSLNLRTWWDRRETTLCGRVSSAGRAALPAGGAGELAHDWHPGPGVWEGCHPPAPDG